ncbi:putative ARM-like repeat-containing protein [Fusarium oxysporum f. sp. albedinis]|nr:putative ARM-like repeat-containing protein [Fusarium oxysporum f. sp. albedinis]
MSVEVRTSLNCLRHPSRFTSVCRTQLSRVHTGDNCQNIQCESGCLGHELIMLNTQWRPFHYQEGALRYSE